MRIATYLKFNGRCEEAVGVYKELFKAEVTCFHRFDQSMTNSPELVGKVFHAELKIREFYIFLADTLEVLDYEKQAYKITVECDTLADAEKYFCTLQANGSVIEPLRHMPWGDYMGHLRDAFGITWDIVFCG